MSFIKNNYIQLYLTADSEKLAGVEKLLIQVRWLILFTVTVFLLIGIPSLPLHQPALIFLLTGTLIYTFLLHYISVRNREKPINMVQVGIFSTILDCVAISTLIYLTGGLVSPFYLLYFLSILSVSMRFDFRPTIEISGFNIILYMIVILSHESFVLSQNEIMQFTLRSLFMFVAAILGGYLALEERKQRIAKEKVQIISESTSELLENLFKTQTELEKRFHQLETLYDLAREISTNLDLDRMMQIALRITTEKMEARMGVLALYDPQKRGLDYRATYGTPFSSKDYNKLIQPLKGKGIEYWVLTSQQPLLLPDVNMDERWRELPQKINDIPVIRSALCVPLMAQGKVLGTITLTHQDKGFFDMDDQKMLISISEQIALAVINSQLYTELNARVNALVTLNILAVSLSSTLETDGVLETVFTQTRQIISANQLRLIITDPLNQNGTYKVWRKKIDTNAGQSTIQAEEEIIQWVIVNKKYLLIREGTFKEWSNYSISDYDPDIQFLLAVPLIAKDTVLGVLLVTDTKRSDTFIEDDINTLLTIGRYAGIALENARLYEHTHQSLIERGRELEMMYHSSALISSAQTVKELPELILQMTMNALNADQGVFYLWKSENNILEIASQSGYNSDDICLPEKILQEKLPLQLNNRINNFFQDTGIRPNTDSNMILDMKNQYTLTVPCLFKDKLIGILHVQRNDPKASFTQHELHLLSAIANHTAIATERARLYEELQEHRSTLTKLFSVVVTAQEDERQRVARDIHDGIAQAMYNCLYKIQTCNHLLTLDMEKARLMLNNTESALRDCMVDIRRLLFDLRPAALDELGLIDALKVYLQRYEEDKSIKTHMILTPNLQINQDSLPLLHAAQVALYRIVQEGLNNVYRHAQAENVTVSMGIFDISGNQVEFTNDQLFCSLIKSDAYFVLKIEDDGIGLDTSKTLSHSKDHLGLAGIRERVDMLGGSFHVHSAENGGLILEVKIPVQSSIYKTTDKTQNVERVQA